MDRAHRETYVTCGRSPETRYQSVFKTAASFRANPRLRRGAAGRRQGGCHSLGDGWVASLDRMVRTGGESSRHGNRSRRSFSAWMAFCCWNGYLTISWSEGRAKEEKASES